MKLNGKRVLVTGASQGLGAGIARSFAAAGATTVLVARQKSQLDALAKEIDGEVIAGDLLDQDFTASLIYRATENAPLDILVNNAGIEIQGTIAQQSPSDLTAVLRLNLEVPTVLTHYALDVMMKRGSGHIVNISSLAMAVNTAGWATYGASKAGLSSLSSSLRRELQDTNIGLTVAELGLIDTPMATEILSHGPAKAMFARYERLGLSPVLTVEEVADALRDTVEHDRSYLRMPKRSMAFPMLTNIARRTGDLLQTGVSIDE